MFIIKIINIFGIIISEKERINVKNVYQNSVVDFQKRKKESEKLNFSQLTRKITKLQKPQDIEKRGHNFRTKMYFFFCQFTVFLSLIHLTDNAIQSKEYISDAKLAIESVTNAIINETTSV